MQYGNIHHSLGGPQALAYLIIFNTLNSEIDNQGLSQHFVLRGYTFLSIEGTPFQSRRQTLPC